MPQYTISLAQMNIVVGDEAQNIATFQQMTADAAQAGSDLVVFPELWSTGYVLPQAEDYASTRPNGIYETITAAAQDHNITIVGSVLEQTEQGVANSLAVVTPDGTLQGTYHKLHLFRLFDEEKYLQEGAKPLCLDMDWGKTGFGICYDLRFPELFRHYSRREGVELMILPAEWPLVRVEHWRALLIARAIENQAFVIACNSAGQSGETVFAGHSMIIDPWGKIIAEGDEQPTLITATIDTDVIAEARGKIPVFEDIRQDIYG